MVSGSSRCDGQTGAAAVRGRLLRVSRVVGHLVDSSMVLTDPSYSSDVPRSAESNHNSSICHRLRPRSPSRGSRRDSYAVGKRVPTMRKREAEQHGHGRFHRGGGACDEVLEAFGHDGSRHVRGFGQEAREAGGSSEGALEPEVRFSSRCPPYVPLAPVKPDQRGSDSSEAICTEKQSSGELASTLVQAMRTNDPPGKHYLELT